MEAQCTSFGLVQNKGHSRNYPLFVLLLSKHQDLLVISCLQKYFKGKRRDSNEQQGFSVAIVVQHPQESLTCQWA